MGIGCRACDIGAGGERILSLPAGSGISSDCVCDLDDSDCIPVRLGHGGDVEEGSLDTRQEHEQQAAE